jgi:KaiC/GvpD/RAD55 family RecA-like ATPase
VLTDRIACGVPGFDSLVDGGIPAGNVVLLAGRAGTGKTIFCAQYLYHGSKLGEKTLYISLIEDRERFLRNMKRFGLELEAMEAKGMMKVLNISIPQAGQQDAVSEQITKAFEEFKPSRAVLDPFSALTIPISASRSDSQAFVHSLLSKLSRHESCTTILVCEVGAGADQIGTGIEEYAADGIIVFYYLMRGKAKIKAVEIRKMRGTKHSNQAILLEITENGIVIDPDIELTS